MTTTWRQPVACSAVSWLYSGISHVSICMATCRASSSGSGRLELVGRQPRISSLYSEVPDTSTRNPSTCRQQRAAASAALAAAGLRHGMQQGLGCAGETAPVGNGNVPSQSEY